MFYLEKKYGKISGVVGLDDFEIDVTGVAQLRIVKDKGYSKEDFAELMIELVF